MSCSVTYGNARVPVLLSQFAPLSPSPEVPTTLFSVSLSPLLPYLYCKIIDKLEVSKILQRGPLNFYPFSRKVT